MKDCYHCIIIIVKQLELKPELKDVLRELYTKIADKWEDIGIFLSIIPGKLDAIKSSDSQSHNRLREMLKVWLQQVEPAPTWKAMVKAIRDVGNDNLASELEKKYCIVLQ